MDDRKQQLEQAGPIRVEVGSDGSYGIGWKSATRPDSNVLVFETTPRSELTMKIELGECVRNGVQHKRLWIRVSCDGALGECHEDQQVTAFRDAEHTIRWVHDMIGYLNYYLPDRLRTMALLTITEAIAKSSEVHGIAETDWKELAESHAAIVGQKIKDSHGVHSGPQRFFETKQQYLDFLAEAARANRAAGERFTQEWVAKFASDKFSDSAHERTIDARMVRQWNKDFQVNWEYWETKVNRRN
jgi:hypothetical protein